MYWTLIIGLSLLNLHHTYSTIIESLHSKFFKTSSVSFRHTLSTVTDDVVLILDTIDDPSQDWNTPLLYNLKQFQLDSYSTPTTSSVKECQIALSPNFQFYSPIKLGEDRVILVFISGVRFKLQIIDMTSCTTINEVALNHTIDDRPMAYLGDTVDFLVTLEETFEVFYQDPKLGETMRTEYDHSGKQLSNGVVHIEASDVYTCMCSGPDDCSHCNPDDMGFGGRQAILPVDRKSSEKGYYFVLGIDDSRFIELISRDGRPVRRTFYKPAIRLMTFRAKDVCSATQERLAVCSALECVQFDDELEQTLRVANVTGDLDWQENESGIVVVNVFNPKEGIVILVNGCQEDTRSFVQLVKLDRKGRIVAKSKNIILHLDQCLYPRHSMLKTNIVERELGIFEISMVYLSTDPDNLMVSGLMGEHYRIIFD